ncbi:MAG: hypothetical protein J6W64_00640 [Bacilli bacterium]|nr:hypothetical protein [Bacilli bacterium]
MIAICRDKGTGLISRIIQLSNTDFIQKQLDELQLTDKYYIDYFVGDVENSKNEQNNNT